MSKNYFPEYAFPMVDEELLKREPDDQDNPYFVMEHVLACREQGLDSEDWHDKYIDKILTGVLKENVDAELDVYRGMGKNGDRYRWTEYHRIIDMICDGYHKHKNGNEFEDDPEYIPLSLKGVPGILESLGDKYDDAPATMKSIFDKSKLPIKRTPLENRKTKKTDNK